ncbi:hypothetical protein BD560DRAFT_395049 [Blakeslea trispora]|nr:hypothetical protein BD560DRAFT_395049 [Blakeslea trispora]
MLTRIFNSIRETINRSGNRNTPNNNNNKHTASDSRRPSVTETCDEIAPHTFSTQESMPQPMPQSMPEPITIVGSAPTSSNHARRRSSLFGISNVTYDDYVQKDLVSSSWS